MQEIVINPLKITTHSHATFSFGSREYQADLKLMIQKAELQDKCSICQTVMTITDVKDEDFGGATVVAVEAENDKLFYASGKVVPEDSDDMRRVERFLKEKLIGAKLCSDHYYDVSSLLVEDDPEEVEEEPAK